MVIDRSKTNKIMMWKRREKMEPICDGKRGVHANVFSRNRK